MTRPPWESPPTLLEDAHRQAEAKRRRRAELAERRRHGLRARHHTKLTRQRRKDQRQMAHKTDRNPFTPFLNGFSYEQGFDGSAWQLTRGEDFSLAPNTIAQAIREEYERRYGRLLIKVEGDTVTVRRVSGGVTST